MTRLTSIDAPFWRMIRVPYQRDPLSGEGARLYGGRWNPKGMPALYLGAGHDVAIAEYYRGLPKPGTLVPYAIRSDAIADLGDASDPDVAQALACDWTAQMRAGKEPSSWVLARHWIDEGAHGALVPSIQQRGGTALVLWRWHNSAQDGDGASVTFHDPLRDLLRP